MNDHDPGRGDRPRTMASRFSRIAGFLIVATIVVAAEVGALGLLFHAVRFARDAILGGR